MGSKPKLTTNVKNSSLTRKTIQAALGGLVYFIVAALPAPAQGVPHASALPSLKGIFDPGVRAEVWTVKGEAIWLDGLRLETPTDFDTAPAGQPIARISSDAPLPGGDQFFPQIQRMILGELTTTFHESHPQMMMVYRLGDPRNAVPPPPDWQRTLGQVPYWHRAAAVPNTTGLPFLNHSVYCWTARAGEGEEDLGIYLFQQSFRIERADTIARATLRLATNVDLIEGAFNAHPLHLAGGRKPAIAEFEVTPLMREGDNLVALRVRGRSGVLAANYGLAFHLEVTRRKATGAPVPQRDPAAVLATSRDGDRAWGTLADLSGDRILLATQHGNYVLDWDNCSSLLFPGGWQPPKPQPRLADRLTDRLLRRPAPIDSLDEVKLYGLPLWMLPNRLEDCLLLSEGRLTMAHPSRAGGGQLYFEGAEGQELSMPLGEVLGIFPPRPERQELRREQHAVAVLTCQVLTRTGEIFNGLLRRVGLDQVVVQTAGGQILKIKAGSVATIQFPYHSAMLSAAEARKGPITLLAQTSDGDKFRERYEEDSRRVQQACFVAGAEFKLLPLEDEANANTLQPGRYPVLVTVDPVGEYLDSWFGNGDAREALVKYVSEGGVVVALSRGGAFRTAVANRGGGTFNTVTPKPDLAEQLGLRTVRPADSASGNVTAFDQPPNDGGSFFFQRGTQLPEGLGALPRRIDLPPLESAPYYPMVAGAGQQTVIYTLTDARGRAYGPGLSLLAHGRGWIMIVDHLLWESRVDERPFTERALPLLLRWAVTNSGH